MQAKRVTKARVLMPQADPRLARLPFSMLLRCIRAMGGVLGELGHGTTSPETELATSLYCDSAAICRDLCGELGRRFPLTAWQRRSVLHVGRELNPITRHLLLNALDAEGHASAVAIAKRLRVAR